MSDEEYRRYNMWNTRFTDFDVSSFFLPRILFKFIQNQTCIWAAAHIKILLKIAFYSFVLFSCFFSSFLDETTKNTEEKKWRTNWIIWWHCTIKHNRTWLHNRLIIACVLFIRRNMHSQEFLIKLYHLLLFHFLLISLSHLLDSLRLILFFFFSVYECVAFIFTFYIFISLR